MSEHDFHHEVLQSDSFRTFGHKSVREDPIFKEPNEIPSNINTEVLSDTCKALENIRHKSI